MPQPFIFRTVDLDGQTIRTAVRPGKSHLTPLLIFNGIGANLELVFPFVQALDPDLEVIAFDVPGVGGSSTPRRPYRFPGLAKLTARMLDYLDYGQVNVIGVSWGGALAQQFAHDYPERCKKLVLAATAAGAVMVTPTVAVAPGSNVTVGTAKTAVALLVANVGTYVAGPVDTALTDDSE